MDVRYVVDQSTKQLRMDTYNSSNILLLSKARLVGACACCRSAAVPESAAHREIWQK